MVVLAVPMAVLVSTLITFGKFSENSELDALKAAGIHPFRIITPVLFAGLILSISMVWFSNEVLPEANYKARALFMDIRMKKPGFDLKENEFYDGLEGYTFLVREIPAGTDSLLNVTLFQEATQSKDRAIIKAKKGFLESDEELMLLTLYLEEGSILRYISDVAHRSTLLEETSFERYRISFDISDLSFSRTNPDRRRRDGRTMRAQAMKAAVDSIQIEKNRELNNFLLTTTSLNLKRKSDQRVDISPELEDNLTGESIELDPPSDTAARIDGRNDPEPSIFLALDQLQSLEEQQHIARQGVLGFRKTISDIDNVITSLTWRAERQASFMVEIHKKFSIPIACMIFILIGAPLGMLTKKGNLGVNALIATVLFTYYWLSIIQGEKLADRLIVSPFVGMWFANFTLLILGIFLMLKISREHNIFRLR